MLFLHGGPGTAQIAFAPKFQKDLEKVGELLAIDFITNAAKLEVPVYILPAGRINKHLRH